LSGQEFLANLWKSFHGGTEVDHSQKLPDLEILKKTEWSDYFERLMRNRMIVGAFRYGRLHDKKKKKWNRVESAIIRLKLYEQTGNLEHLVDVANMCLLEFEIGAHPKKHFQSADDQHHTRGF